MLIVLPEMLLSFKASDEQAGITYLTQALKGDHVLAGSVASALVKDRAGLERADAIRSLIFVGLTFGLVWALIKQKIGVQVASVALLVLTMADLWQVDKRYLKDANFTEKQEAAISPREVDLEIAKDTDPDFRVFDATADIKMDVIDPFFHKSIGGYSAARLKRYDELIDNQLSGKSLNQQVLNMLNTKYFIVPDSAQKNLVVQPNPVACGNAWYVHNIRYAVNADQEMKALDNFSPKEEAVVDEKYKNLIGQQQPSDPDPQASIKLISYNPDHMAYSTSTAMSQTAVFSEIFYDRGWDMFIDGTKKPYFRADYLLRAAQIPAGNHKVEFIFHPASYYTGDVISLISSILLVLLLVYGLFEQTIKHNRLNQKV